jgi:asparaginyl-tRNA synthetase
MRYKINTFKDSKNKETYLNQTVTIKGWVRTSRHQKTCSFIEVNDGSTLAGMQVLIPSELKDYASLVERLTTGAAVAVVGKVLESPGKGQELEIHAESVEIVGECPSQDYPLQKKSHSFEFLRTIAHLRPRTNTLGAVARVRSALAFATHKFFQERGFLYIQTPIITASDCEGAGEMFRVTSLDMDNLPKDKEGKVDHSKEFFGKPAYLTVSGQLNGEIFASALSDVYTFGPTFRAENSNTKRHLAEFWMIEPEIAFANLQDNADLSEAYLKYIIKYALDNCTSDLEFFDQRISNGLIERLKEVVEKPFERATYTYAVRILEKSGATFEYPISWGADLQTEHERYLTEKYFGKPVIITDYPKEIKSFYMRLSRDEKTVAAMDVLVPTIGEIIGGSQREERYDVLKSRMKEKNLSEENYWWYLELRKFGSVPHAGFGAGFERLVQFATGIENIRDAIAFPRTPMKVDF